MQLTEPHHSPTPARLFDRADTFNDLIVSLYQGCNSAEGFNTFVEQVKQRYRLSGCAITSVQHTSQQVAKFWIAGIDRSMVEWYLEENRLYRDPMRQRLTQQRLDSFDALKLSQPGGELHDMLDLQGEFDHVLDALKLVDIAGLNIFSNDEQSMAMFLHRSAGETPFTHAEVTELNHLVPHIRQAIELYRGLYDKQVENLGLSQALDVIDKPLLIVNHFMEICFINQAGKRILLDSSDLQLQNNCLTFSNTDAQQELTRYLHSVFTLKHLDADPIIQIPRADRPPLRMALSPVSQTADNFYHCVMIQLLEDSTNDTPSMQQIQQTMGLTKAEARVCEGLCEGKSIKQIAEKLSRQESTVRSNLKSAFVKTGHRSQSQLVAAIYRCCL